MATRKITVSNSEYTLLALGACFVETKRNQIGRIFVGNQQPAPDHDAYHDISIYNPINWTGEEWVWGRASGETAVEMFVTAVTDALVPQIVIDGLTDYIGYGMAAQIGDHAQITATSTAGAITSYKWGSTQSGIEFGQAASPTDFTAVDTGDPSNPARLFYEHTINGVEISGSIPIRTPAVPYFVQPTITGNLVVPGVVDLAVGDIASNVTGVVGIEIVEFTLDGVNKVQELAGLGWDTTDELGGEMRLQTRTVTSGGYILSDVVTENLQGPEVADAPTTAPTFASDSVTDATPSFNIGDVSPNTPNLYIDGSVVASTYDPATGIITADNAVTFGVHAVAYSLTSISQIETTLSPSVNIDVLQATYVIASDQTGEIDFSDEVPDTFEVTIDFTVEPWASRSTGPVTIAKGDMNDGIEGVYPPLISGLSGLGESPTFAHGFFFADTKDPPVTYTLRSDGVAVAGFVGVTIDVLRGYAVTAAEQGTDLTIDELSNGQLVHSSAAFAIPAAQTAWTQPSLIADGESTTYAAGAFSIPTVDFGVTGKLLLLVCKGANGGSYTVTGVRAGGVAATPVQHNAANIIATNADRATVELWEANVTAAQNSIEVDVTNNLAATGVKVIAIHTPDNFQINDVALVSGGGASSFDLSLNTTEGGAVFGAMQVAGGLGDLANLVGSDDLGTPWVRLGSTNNLIARGFMSTDTPAESDQTISFNNTGGVNNSRYAGVAVAISEVV